MPATWWQRCGWSTRVTSTDPWFNEIVRLLHERSGEFAAWWDEQLVQPPRDGTKHYDHPQAGRLSFDYTVLDVADERFASLQLISYFADAGNGNAREDGAAAPSAPRREVT